MNPNNYESGLRLPEPVTAPEPGAGQPERVAAPESASSSGAQAPALNPSMVPIPAAVPTQALTQQFGTSSPTSLTPSLADDADLIEKEWVVKAKAIVERTKEDPHEQTSEVNQFKADYLKKRYNKDIKVSES